MSEISQIIIFLGKALDHAVVYGLPTEEPQKAYQAAVSLKSKLMPDEP